MVFVWYFQVRSLRNFLYHKRLCSMSAQCVRLSLSTRPHAGDFIRHSHKQGMVYNSVGSLRMISCLATIIDLYSFVGIILFCTLATSSGHGKVTLNWIITCYVYRQNIWAMWCIWSWYMSHDLYSRLRIEALYSSLPAAIGIMPRFVSENKGHVRCILMPQNY